MSATALPGGDVRDVPGCLAGGASRWLSINPLSRFTAWCILALAPTGGLDAMSYRNGE
ncbi:hypothetical protein [Acidovorax sp. HMWF029]|uniref:hypothetical protein n=1 Tax=Acidovorax sp. HMWF029 TaxID=2056863 RepID=UPI001304A302|nr:hypothetical protein [Acidovorax sp. HMWF029]